MSPSTVHEDLPARLKAAADHVNDLYVAWSKAVIRRNQLIVAAVDDAGMTQHQVARETGLKQPSINRILGKSGDLDDLDLEQEKVA